MVRLIASFLSCVLFVLLFAAASDGGETPGIAPGLYLRTTYAFGNLSLNTIYIGAGNRIAIDPRGGIDPFDFEAAAKQAPARVGTFKIDGKKIVITWANSKVDRLSVEFTRGQFSVYDGGLVSKAQAFPADGKMLTGTFAVSGQTKNLSVAGTLVLTADGQYTKTISAGRISGNYKLYGNTLELKASTVAVHSLITKKYRNWRSW